MQRYPIGNGYAHAAGTGRIQSKHSGHISAETKRTDRTSQQIVRKWEMAVREHQRV